MVSLLALLTSMPINRIMNGGLTAVMEPMVPYWVWWNKLQCQSVLATLPLRKSCCCIHIYIYVTICMYIYIYIYILIADYLLDADYLVEAHGIIIDYKCGWVVIEDNKIPFTLKSDDATIRDLSMCDRIISVLNTIPDCTIQHYLISAYQIKQS